MRTVIFLSTIFLFLKAGSVEKNTMKSEVTQIAEGFLDKPGTQGLSIGIIKGGQTYTYCFGNSCESPYSPVKAENLFEIGSITKVFTGILFADQVLSNGLNPDSRLADYVSFGSPYSNVTLRQLATHSSGLPRLADNFWNCVKDPGNPYAGYSDNDLRAYLSNVKPVSQPGERYLYSNVGMGVLGWVISDVNQKPYEELLKERVINQLGLSNTSATLTSSQKRNLATGYSQGSAVKNWDFQNCTSAQGSLRSDINDMITFAQANLHPEKTPIEAAIRMSQEIHFKDPVKNRLMGLGWHIGYFNGDKYLEHTGGTGGYRSFIGLVPGKDMAVIVLSNSDQDVALMGVEILKSVSVNPHL